MNSILAYDKITPETDFYDDIGGDSLDLVEFVMALEEKYDLEIPEIDDDTEKARKMGDVHEYLNEHIS